ncbi:NUDIX hydrolase [Lacrimispora celerecrescens]|uniref:ADP-ribose pyrophosphatase YjhB (NUDIX family) n=1 Tax=[Clostridium] celerecrescens 18A TaxID=1286362 RepID=A0A2M8Z350_9FIRM|nr:NUDIX hydrolase [Lacrimispora celerecrescens]PJJ27861.1 ADP-ribose pyrophosphatase YjhB (NUDIX family) [[Clostridium] celerecrescens 18A]
MDCKEKFRKTVEDFLPYNEQEERDKEMLLQYLSSGESIFSRESLGAHMSASAWVVNRSHDKVLMAYHNIYDSWAWTGGHADGEMNLLQVAVREAMEETGIRTVRPVTEDIFSLEVLTVDGHEKRGAYVSSHLHLNVTYLLEADDREVLHKKADENSAVGWFGVEECLKAVNEPWMRERIYQKLLDKMRDINF